MVQFQKCSLLEVFHSLGTPRRLGSAVATAKAFLPPLLPMTFNIASEYRCGLKVLLIRRCNDCGLIKPVKRGIPAQCLRPGS